MTSYIIGRDTFGNNAKANAGFYVKYPGGFDSNSVAMYSIDKPGRVSITNPQSVQVSFKNKGLNNLKSAELHWSLNGVYDVRTIFHLFCLKTLNPYLCQPGHI